ncbi:DUF3048 domain-containing protein [Streptomyces sodiiphilus]|uniref:DUF3048 domain-containing protein n=2 Tax=Streptomyces sodiiphilus TaxID=226217 RepID=A0ABN2PRI7_9ACTN
MAAFVVILAALTGGCQTGNGEDETPPDGVSPFTGEEAEAGPVLAVKIDNVERARPHTGLEDADLVYVEPVESGLTRLLVVFSGSLPETAGPVRSARESDLELLRQFGRPALAYSGAQSALQPLIDEAPLYAVPPDRASAAYERSGDRPAPHNLYLRPDALLLAAPEASEAADIGLRFGDAPDGGTETSEYTVTYQAASYDFGWSGEDGRWLVSMDGTEAVTTGGERLSAATVVVQQVQIRPSAFQDRSGNITPYTQTIGSGEALVLRDGQAHEARWSRSAADGGTTFTTADGDPLPFATGPVWFLFTDS